MTVNIGVWKKLCFNTGKGQSGSLDFLPFTHLSWSNETNHITYVRCIFQKCFLKKPAFEIFFFSYRLIFCWIYSTRIQFSHRIEGVVEASFLCWFFKITQNWLLFSDSWVTLQCQIIVSHFIYNSATTTGDFYRRKTI